MWTWLLASPIFLPVRTQKGGWGRWYWWLEGFIIFIIVCSHQVRQPRTASWESSMGMAMRMTMFCKKKKKKNETAIQECTGHTFMSLYKTYVSWTDHGLSLVLASVVTWICITRSGKETNRIHRIPFIYYQSNMFQPKWRSWGTTTKILEAFKTVTSVKCKINK
jgi:hypothetical protein